MRKRLSYCLILVFALQSVAVLADVHQLHQDGGLHLTYIHSHDREVSDIDRAKTQIDEPSNNLGGDQGRSVFDCHHCCHCHQGLHLVALPLSMLAAQLPPASIATSGYQSRLLSSPPGAHFRPPRH